MPKTQCMRYLSDITHRWSPSTWLLLRRASPNLRTSLRIDCPGLACIKGLCSSSGKLDQILPEGRYLNLLGYILQACFCSSVRFFYDLWKCERRLIVKMPPIVNLLPNINYLGKAHQNSSTRKISESSRKQANLSSRMIEKFFEVTCLHHLACICHIQHCCVYAKRKGAHSFAWYYIV